MEKVSGRPLAELWEGLQADDQLAIVEQIAQFQSKLASFRFPSYGSIFYADDVDPPSGLEIHQDKVTREFVVGPTTDRAYFDNRRNEVESVLGPWHTAEEYLLAIIKRESACGKKSGRSGRNQGIYYAPGLFSPTADSKVASLSKAKLILKQMLSTDGLDMTPTIWPPNMHGNNIFVDPEQPSQITGIIDWQAVNVTPRSLQVDYASFLENASSLPPGLRRVQLPDSDDMDEEQQRAAKRAQSAKSLLKMYELELFRRDQNPYKALTW